jgi:hypothetical protein
MERKLNNTVRKATLVMFAALMTLAVGCGDGFFTQEGGTFRSALAEQVKGRMGGENRRAYRPSSKQSSTRPSPPSTPRRSMFSSTTRALR